MHREVVQPVHDVVVAPKASLPLLGRPELLDLADHLVDIHAGPRPVAVLAEAPVEFGTLCLEFGKVDCNVFEPVVPLRGVVPEKPTMVVLGLEKGGHFGSMLRERRPMSDHHVLEKASGKHVGLVGEPSFTQVNHAPVGQCRPRVDRD